jgi:hypothetical protein
VIELYTRLVAKNTDQGGARKPAELIDEPDIKRELIELQKQGKLHDVPENKA